MRPALYTAILVISVVSPAIAKDREVRIFINDEVKHWVTGSVVSAKNLHTILFINEPCPLQIAGAQNMRRAWMAFGAYQLGCWYPTQNGQYVFVGRIPQATHASGAYWEAHPRATLHSDGSATITEENYDSKTFLKRLLNRKAMEVFEHTNEQP